MATPKINDQFWFDYSEKIVKAASESGDSAASKIQNLALWLWGVYTSGAAIGFALASKRLPIDATLLIALGSACIIAVYWAAVWVQVPVVVEFEPRSPDEIMNVYSTAVRTKKYRLKLTLGLSAVAAVFVSFALITAAVAKGVPPPFGEFQVARSKSGLSRSVAVAGNIGASKEVVVAVSSTDELPNNWRTGATTLIPLKSGIIQTALPISDELLTNRIFVTFEWIDGAGAIVRVTKRVQGN